MAAGRIPAARGLLVLAIFVLGLFAAPAALAAGSPVLSGFISNDPNLSGTTSVAISGHYAYTTAYYAGELTAVDFSNPAAPVVAGSSAFSSGLVASSTVNIAGGYAYVVSKNRNGTNGSGSNDDGTGNSLTILNISTNPARPQIVGSVRDATKLFGGYGVAVSGNYAYVAAQGCLGGQPCPKPSVGNSFEVVDISNPAAPTIVATLHNTALPAPFTGTNALYHACSVAISGHYAFVTAAYSNRLTIIDIANPLSPVIVSSLLDNTQLSFPVDVAVKGNYAYVADQASGLGRVAVVDVSNPASPQINAAVTDSSTLNGAYRIRVSGNFAYVSGVYAATVTAIDISNPLVPREAGHVTDTAHLNRTTGLDVDPTSHYVVASSPYLSTQSQPLYPPYPPAAGGPTMTGSISAITLDPAPIGVSITPASEPANPTTQTSASFTFSTSDAVASVQCSLDGASFGSCTSPTSQQYASLSPGSHTFTAQATDAAGTTASASYAWAIQQPQQPPVNTAPPSISGTASAGSQLTASNGTWTGSPAPTFGYQWSDCDSAGANCNAILGATASTYTAQGSDVGFTLEVTVTGANTAGSALATSGPTAVVTAATSAPVNTAPPSISGSAVEAQTLTASAGSWTGTPAPTFAYQWSDCNANGANCNPISGATASTYSAVSADVGSTLKVAVTASNAAGSSQATSTPTALVTSAPGPVTPLLDDFNRANNGGPPSANWSHMPVSSTNASSNLLITAQQVTGLPGSNGEWWNPQTFGPNSEEWLTVATKPNVDFDPVVLGLRFTNPGSSSATGYQAYYIYHSKQPDQYRISRRVNGATTATLATANGPSLTAGDTLLFRAIGATLELWRQTGTTWTRILTANDTTITGAGYLALSTRNAVVRLDNFGGGTLP